MSLLWPSMCSPCRRDGDGRVDREWMDVGKLIFPTCKEISVWPALGGVRSRACRSRVTAPCGRCSLACRGASQWEEEREQKSGPAVKSLIACDCPLRTQSRECSAVSAHQNAPKMPRFTLREAERRKRRPGRKTHLKSHIYRLNPDLIHSFVLGRCFCASSCV